MAYIKKSLRCFQEREMVEMVDFQRIPRNANDNCKCR